MRKIIYTLFLLLFTAGVTFAQSTYRFNGKEVKPGTKQNFLIPVISGNDSTFIPITVFNGVKDGKVLGITAGVHGYEYAPILGAQKLIKSINPQQLTGVVILVQIANFESFRGRSPYVSPLDKKNLNRSFPGSSTGTITERVAHFITTNIIVKSDYFLDMHSGDAPEDLLAYGAYYSNSGMPAISQTAKEMAIALGFDYLVKFDTDGKKYMDKNELSLYTTAEAFKRGIPAIDIECGRLGIVETVLVNKIEKSVIDLLGYLTFLPKEKVVAKKMKMPVAIKNRTYLSSKNNGLFYPLAKAGALVKKGMEIGYTTNCFGQIIEKFYAQEDGLILMIVSTPPINKDEDVIVLGKL